ncbi:MAG TPA: hypothetical protein VKE69_13565 [Planctomycetota bacterium]|nr:hypothetical protein [Planctomycetota bacterium]
MIAILLQAGLLATIAVGAGLLVADPSRFVALRVGRLAFAALAGFFALAAVLSCIAVFGAPRWAVLALGYAMAAAGFVRESLRAGAARSRWRRELAAIAPVALLASTGAISALSAPTISHDATVIWYPKTVEAADDVPVDPEAFATNGGRHAHAEYPRGLAWLASIADPTGAGDPRLVRVVALAVVLAGVLSIAGWFAKRDDLAGGVLASSLVLLIPEMAAQCHVGLADAPLGMAVVLVGLALTQMRDDGRGLLLAAIGGAGGAATKQEGAVLWLTAAAVVATRWIRPGASSRGERALATAVLLTVMPWWLGCWKGSPEERAQVSLFLADPDFIAVRFAEEVKKLALTLRDPNLIEPSAGFDPEPPLGAAWFAAVCIPLARFARRKPVVAAPAFVLLSVQLVFFLVTPHPLSWHLRTTVPRLPLQWLPLLVVAVVASARPAPRAT